MKDKMEVKNMTITFKPPTDKQVKLIACVNQKIFAMDALLADLQTRRAKAEVKFRDEENKLTAEKNKAILELRNIRPAVITESTIVTDSMTVK